MFEEGNIIYFDPFYFKNGNTAKAKYFIVLKKLNDGILLACLPTRKDTIPSNVDDAKGCVEIPDINFNSFVITTDLVVTECGKKFDFTTYFYGYQVDDYFTESLKEIYPNEGSDYLIWGKMKQKLFEDLINCFKNSKAVKRKYKRSL